MNKTVALTACLLIIGALIVSALVLPTGTPDNQNQNNGSAFVIWGTRDYSDENFMGAEPEQTASQQVCEEIFGLASDSQQFGYCKNFWGSNTQPEQVYANVSYCEENYDFTAIFYKGHSIGTYCDIENCTLGEHWTIYADGGYNEEYIMDHLIHERLSSATHDFVFLWTCGYASDERIGKIDENGHSVGMLVSWMNETDLGSDGYAEPDGSNHCFIGFDDYSIWFTNKTGYADFCYGDFASLFFEYALMDGWTVNDALDAAAEETHVQASFGDCQLYTGYPMPDAENIGETATCYMRLWGDGNLKLQQKENLSSLQSKNSPEAEKVLEYLEDVVGFDVSKYDAQLLGTSETYPDWLNGLQQTGKIVLESEASKIDVLYKFRNNTLSWCLVRPTEGSPCYSEPLSTGVGDSIDDFLERYQTFSNNLGIQQMRNMLFSSGVTENATKTEGNMKLVVSVTDFSVSVEFTNNEGKEGAVVVSFRDGHFYAFSDSTGYS